MLLYLPTWPPGDLMDVRVLHALASRCAERYSWNPTGAFAGDVILHGAMEDQTELLQGWWDFNIFLWVSSVWRKENFSHNLPDPWEHRQPCEQSPGTRLDKSVPWAISPHQICREDHLLHHHPAQERLVVPVCLIVFGSNDRSARREGCNAAGSDHAVIFIFSSICC